MPLIFFPAVPARPPLNLRVVVEAQDIIMIAWDPIPCLFRNSPVSYQVHVTGETSLSTVVQSESYTLHASRSNAIYFFAVHGHYNGLLSPSSEVIPVISASKERERERERRERERDEEGKCAQNFTTSFLASRYLQCHFMPQQRHLQLPSSTTDRGIRQLFLLPRILGHSLRD